MIHGFTGNHEGFQYIQPLLDQYHLIIPDLPGFGASTITSDDWSIDAIASLLNEFVEKLALPKPPHIFGHSMGGLVVASMVDQRPDLYANVVLVAPVPTAVERHDSRYIGSRLGEFQYKLGHKLPFIGTRLVKSRLISRAITSRLTTTPNPELRRNIYQHHYDNLDRISDIEFYEVLNHDINRRGAIDYAPELKKKRLLLIVNDSDIVTPFEQQKRLIDTIKPERVLTIPGANHLSHYEYPEAIAQATLQFLDHHSSR